MNVLFPHKLINILNRLEKNTKWKCNIDFAKRYTELYENDGMTRVALTSPQLMHIIPDILPALEYFRVRLAYTPDFIRAKYVYLEIYDIDGKLVHRVEHSEWSTLLSLAIESEMLEMLLNINPW